MKEHKGPNIQHLSNIQLAIQSIFGQGNKPTPSLQKDLSQQLFQVLIINQREQYIQLSKEYSEVIFESKLEKIKNNLFLIPQKEISKVQNLDQKKLVNEFFDIDEKINLIYELFCQDYIYQALHSLENKQETKFELQMKTKMFNNLFQFQNTIINQFYQLIDIDFKEEIEIYKQKVQKIFRKLENKSRNLISGIYFLKNLSIVLYQQIEEIDKQIQQTKDQQNLKLENYNYLFQFLFRFYGMITNEEKSTKGLNNLLQRKLTQIKKLKKQKDNQQLFQFNLHMLYLLINEFKIYSSEEQVIQRIRYIFSFMFADFINDTFNQFFKQLQLKENVIQSLNYNNQFTNFYKFITITNIIQSDNDLQFLTYQDYILIIDHIESFFQINSNFYDHQILYYLPLNDYFVNFEKNYIYYMEYYKLIIQVVEKNIEKLEQIDFQKAIDEQIEIEVDRNKNIQFYYILMKIMNYLIFIKTSENEFETRDLTEDEEIYLGAIKLFTDEQYKVVKQQMQRLYALIYELDEKSQDKISADQLIDFLSFKRFEGKDFNQAKITLEERNGTLDYDWQNDQKNLQVGIQKEQCNVECQLNKKIKSNTKNKEEQTKINEQIKENQKLTNSVQVQLFEVNETQLRKDQIPQNTLESKVQNTQNEIKNDSQNKIETKIINHPKESTEDQIQIQQEKTVHKEQKIQEQKEEIHNSQPDQGNTNNQQLQRQEVLIKNQKNLMMSNQETIKMEKINIVQELNKKLNEKQKELLEKNIITPEFLKVVFKSDEDIEFNMVFVQVVHRNSDCYNQIVS